MMHLQHFAWYVADDPRLSWVTRHYPDDKETFTDDSGITWRRVAVSSTVYASSRDARRCEGWPEYDCLSLPAPAPAPPLHTGGSV